MSTHLETMASLAFASKGNLISPQMAVRSSTRCALVLSWKRERPVMDAPDDPEEKRGLRRAERRTDILKGRDRFLEEQRDVSKSFYGMKGKWL
jgi:hypothetical protein